MKTVFFILVTFQSFLIFGQNVANSNLTAEYQEVRGSKISIIPPKDFEVATAYMGFQHVESNSSIMVLTISSPFSETLKSLTTESLTRQGLQVEKTETITNKKYSGILFSMYQNIAEVQYRKYILVLGTEKETIIINGITPRANAAIDLAINKALLTAFYQVDKVLTPFDTVDFEISTNDTNLIFAKNNPNMLIYNLDGKIPSEGADKTAFVVVKTLSKAEITDKKQFAANQIKMLPVQITNIKSLIPIEINSLSGYEIYAEGVNRKNGNKEIAYQVILYSDKSYYILYGSAEANFERNLELFKKVAKTFKQK